MILFLKNNINKKSGVVKMFKLFKIKKTEYHKKILTFILVNAIAMMWCSYILAWFGRTDIAESLSETVTTSIVGVVIPYFVTKTIENISKYGSRLNKTTKEYDTYDTYDTYDIHDEANG